MRVTKTWAWYSGSKTWPKFNIRDQDNGDSGGEGLKLDGKSAYTKIKWTDGDHDGLIRDADTDDGSGAGSDRVCIDGKNKIVQESPTYVKSTMMVNGKPVSVTMDVFIFNDGTYMMRLRDADIPKGVGPDAIGQITLGKWDRTEYYGSRTDIRDDPFVCFAAETLIETATGPRPAGSLKVGDLVLTLDNGLRPLRWIGSRAVVGQGDMAPVVIAQGALGNDAELRLSQQHRVLVASWKAELITGEAEVLVAAKHLVNGTTIQVTPVERVTYVHLLFDNHEVVRSHGLWSESFHPGVYGSTRLDEDQRSEIMAIFPELSDRLEGYGPVARLCVKAWEARAIAA